MPFDSSYSGFGPAPTLLTGPNTYNGMGALGASPAPAAAAPSGFSAGMGMSVIGAISSAIGSYYSAQSAKNTLKHQARMGEINARIAELGARSALMQGQRQEQSVRLRGAQVKSRQRVSMAANGIDIANSPTALNLLTSTDYFTESDALTVQRNALASAWGYRTQATDYRSQATMARADARGVSPFSSAATSLIGSANAVADRWYSRNQLRM